MKKHLILAFTALACGLTFTACSDDEDDFNPNDYVTLTFEDADWKGGDNYIGVNNWSSLIDDAQYGGPLLYPVSPDAEIYNWNDENNTFLSHEFAGYYSSKAYYGGGQALSNYSMTDYSTATCEEQLAIPVEKGHNNSDNFCVFCGGESTPSDLVFSDNVPRVIDHMYVINTSYTLNEMTKEDTEFVNGDDWLKIVAVGYDKNDNVTGTTEFYLAKDGKFVTEWTKFNLSSLGKVLKVQFYVDGSCQNDYGLLTPAYFAYDDVVVRKPSQSYSIYSK